jgi:hypothetical protein
MRAINASFVAVVVLMGCCCPIGRNVNFPQPQPQPQPNGAEKKEPPMKVPPGAEGLFVYTQQLIAEAKTSDTEIIGFPAMNYKYREVPQEGGVLIGLEGAFEPKGTRQIRSVRPIFLTKNGERLGPWIGKDSPPNNAPLNPVVTRGKEGYVVIGMSVRANIFIEGYSLRFAKLDKGRLNLNDNYESPWIGDQRKGDSKNVGGLGVLAVGICGYRGLTHEPCAIGLVGVPIPK